MMPRRDLVQIFNEVRAEYGEPHFPTARNPVGTLNEPFWAALYRKEHDILFEPREHTFYEYGGDIYRIVTAHTISTGWRRACGKVRRLAL